MVKNKGKIPVVVIAKTALARERITNLVNSEDLVHVLGSYENYRASRPHHEGKIYVVEGPPLEIFKRSAEIKEGQEKRKVIYLISDSNQSRVSNSSLIAEQQKCIRYSTIDGLFYSESNPILMPSPRILRSFNGLTLKDKLDEFVEYKAFERELTALVIGAGHLSHKIIEKIMPVCQSIQWYSKYNTSIDNIIDSLHGVSIHRERLTRAKDLTAALGCDPDLIFITRGRIGNVDQTKSRREINYALTLEAIPYMDELLGPFREVQPNGQKVCLTNLPGPLIYHLSEMAGPKSSWTSPSSDQDRFKALMGSEKYFQALRLPKSLLVPIIGEHADTLAPYWKGATAKAEQLSPEVLNNLLQPFIRREEELCNDTINFGNKIKTIAKITGLGDYDVADVVKEYVDDLRFYNPFPIRPMYAHIPRWGLKPLIKYAPDFSLDGAYLMLPVKIRHPTMRTKWIGGLDLDEFSEETKIRLAGALMRQQELVEMIRSVRA